MMLSAADTETVTSLIHYIDKFKDMHDFGLKSHAGYDLRRDLRKLD